MEMERAKKKGGMKACHLRMVFQAFEVFAFSLQASERKIKISITK
jgi:hypothetical protein